MVAGDNTQPGPSGEAEVLRFPFDQSREGIDAAREGRAFERHLRCQSLEAFHNAHSVGIADLFDAAADLYARALAVGAASALFITHTLHAMAADVLHATNGTREAASWRETRSGGK